jgi:two-component system NarL family sensor kinase
MKELSNQENDLISIVIIGFVLLLTMAVALLVFFFLYRKKIIEKELDRKSLEVEHQKEIIKSIIVTQEKERIRIAQDLHDDISSKLNVISLNANLLKDGELSPEEYLIINESILEATDRTLQSARKIAHNLLPPILEKFGLKDALEELVDTYNNSKVIKINYDLSYPKRYLKAKNELHLFRIVQELINNSIRHGKAKNSELSIQVENQKLVFKYKDNGVGFNPIADNHAKGLGMKNIESRVAILEGVHIIESEKEKGFRILITL